LPAARIMALSGTASVNAPYVSGFVADGQVLPLSETDAFKSGHFNHVPVMIGSVRDEGNFFVAIAEYFSGPPRTARTKAAYEAAVTAAYKGNAGPMGAPPAYPAETIDKVRAHYPLSAYPSPAMAMDALLTDPFVCRSWHLDHLLAGQVPVYAYEFADRTAPAYFPEMPGFLPYAYHTSDLQYLFPLYHGGDAGIPHPLNAAQRKLSDRMLTEWTDFARTGNPNGSGNRPWPRFTEDPAKARFLSQNIPAPSTIPDAQFSAAHQCGFWDQALAY
jgi:para-nitrobenzyl esterase